MLEKKEKHSSGNSSSAAPTEEIVEKESEEPLVFFHNNTTSNMGSTAATDQPHSSSSYKSSDEGSNSETTRTNYLQHPTTSGNSIIMEDVVNCPKNSSSSSSSLGRQSKSKDSRNSLDEFIIMEEPFGPSKDDKDEKIQEAPLPFVFSHRMHGKKYYDFPPDEIPPNQICPGAMEYYWHLDREARRRESPIFDYSSDENDDIPIIPGLVMHMSSDIDSAFEDESEKRPFNEKLEDGNQQGEQQHQRKRFRSKPTSPPKNEFRHFRAFSAGYDPDKTTGFGHGADNNQDTWSKYPGFLPNYRAPKRDDEHSPDAPDDTIFEVTSDRPLPPGYQLNVFETFGGQEPEIHGRTVVEEGIGLAPWSGNSANESYPLNLTVREVKPAHRALADEEAIIDSAGGYLAFCQQRDAAEVPFSPVHNYDTNANKTEGEGETGPLIADEENGLFNDDEYETREVAPDGGWGWLVLFGSIIVNILIPGTVKSFGVLFVEFIEVFNASPAAAAWIPAISYFLYSSTGPFASALAIKFSYRAVTIAGGLLASIGLMTSYFANSISYLYISYGVIGGLGAGLAYPIGVFMVARYFDKRRGLANGLCTSGSALGSVIIPPFLRFLLGIYGYRGAILTLGAILLNVCAAAVFYDPVEKHMKQIRVPKVPALNYATGDSQSKNIASASKPNSNSITINSKAPGTTRGREMATSMPIAIPFPHLFQDARFRDSGNTRRATFQIGNETPQGDSWSLRSTDSATPPPSKMLANLDSLAANQSPRISVTRARPPPSSIESTSATSDLETLPTSANAAANPSLPNVSTFASSVASRSRLNLTAIPEDEDSGDCESRADWTSYNNLNSAKHQLMKLSAERGSQLMTSQGSNLHTQPGLSRTLSVASNVSNSSFNYLSTIHHGSCLTSMQYNTTVPDFATSMTAKSVGKSCLDCVTWLPKACLAKCGLFKKSDGDEADFKEKVKKPKQKFIDFSLLNDRLFIIMIISSATTAIGYTNFIILLPAYALKLGFDKSDASLLLSVVALLDFAGRIGGAALTDLRFFSRKWFFVVGLFMSGLALSLLPLAESYSSLAAFCAWFGLASGTYVGLQAVILADRLGSEKLGSSYGITLFVNGIVQLLGPPICGNILESTGDYASIFVGLGCILLAGALIWLLLPFIDKKGPIYCTDQVQMQMLKEPKTNIV